MMAKLISTLELRYPMIQFLIIPFIHERSAIQSMNTGNQFNQLKWPP